MHNSNTIQNVFVFLTILSLYYTVVFVLRQISLCILRNAILVSLFGVKSKRPQVKTSPNGSKRPQTQKKDWSKRPYKTSPFFKGNFSMKYGILTKKKLVLLSGTNV